ncbi:hypothetical protein FISHEDRAFT_78179 [Fistulina hepatica ATCC 64428]|nr:hypothetical protein FISHEDRAFT_78179 [Fistulina hepatica ATCC 64428]
MSSARRARVSSATRTHVPSAKAKPVRDVAAVQKTMAAETARTKRAMAKAQKEAKADAARKTEEERVKEIRKRAAEALANEADSNSDDEDSTPHTSLKKKRRYVSPVRSVPDNEGDEDDGSNEEEDNGGNEQEDIGGNEKGNDGDNEEEADDVDSVEGGFHGDSNQEDAEDNPQDEEDEDANESMDVVSFHDNGINIEELPTKTPVKRGRIRTSHKITRNHFTPISLSLAEKAKRMHRQRICTEDGFPVNKDAFTHKSLRLAAVTGLTNDILKEKLKKIEADIESQSRIFQYVNYSVGGIHGDIKSKARTMLSGHYKIPGNLSKQEIQETVAWLTSKRLYVYSDVDVKKRTYTKTKPYQHPIFFEVLQAQFCSGSGRMDRNTLAVMVCKKEVPMNLIALIATAIDAALAEWVTGEYCQVEFSDDAFASRYEIHCKTLKKLSENSPTYMAYVKQFMLTSVLSRTNKSHLLALQEDDSDDDFDYDALEADAQSCLAPAQEKDEGI